MHTSYQVRQAVFWRAGGQFVNQTVSWLATIIMIRILSPTDYGILAPATLVISFLTLMSAQAFSMGLIHEKSIDRDHIAAVFGYSLMTSICLAAMQILVAPLIATYFRIPEVRFILYALSICHLITPFITIPSALCSRALDFRTTMKVQLVTTLGGSAIGVSLAFFGLGVWALVIAQVATLAVKGIVLSYFKGWLIRPSFSLRHHTSLVRFGGGVTLVSVLGCAYSQSDILVAGRFLQPHDLGIYSTALMLAQIPVSRVLPALNEVGFSALSRMQSRPDLIAKAYLQNIRNVSLIAFPLYLGVACVAEPAVLVVLGPRWNDLITPLVILALSMPIYTVHFQYAPYLYALGRPLALAIAPALGLAVMPMTFWFAVGWGPSGLALAWLVAFPVVSVGSSAIFLPLIGVRYVDMLSALRPAIVASTIMAILIVTLDFALPMHCPEWMRLIALVGAGIIMYWTSMSILFRGCLSEFYVAICG